jgi:hypothetical protein
MNESSKEANNHSDKKNEAKVAGKNQPQSVAAS